MSEKEIAKKTQENLCQIYKVLFDVCKQQKQEAGGEDEILEYTKSKYTIELSEPNVVSLMTCLSTLIPVELRP